MRSSMLLVQGVLLALLVAFSAQAEEVSQPDSDSAAAAPDSLVEDFAEVDPVDPVGAATPLEMAPSAESGETPGVTPEMMTGAVDSTPGLGALGYDSEGRPGRIHLVVSGDTLWDISDAYLGTSWIWPSIWHDNQDIENPHLIYPGDRIWITPTEMRKITAEQAVAFMAGEPAAPEPMPVAEMEDMEPAPEALAVPQPTEMYRVSARESVGLITADSMESAASLVDKVPDRVLLSQEDDVYIGLGEGAVAVGDQFTLFRENEEVHDPDTGQLLGYHVDILGWLEVKEVHPETALAEIRQSISEIAIGDRLIPREEPLVEVPVQSTPNDVDGKISFFPNSRVLMGMADFVYLNRGSLDGLEVGSPLEVYRDARLASEVVRQEQVRVPERVVAKLLVVRTRPESAVAVVTRTDEELTLGDRFRGGRW